MYYLIGIIALLGLAAVFYFLTRGRSEPNNSENDAKRFARLLVSEIKLYNESKIQSALQNNNLFDALRNEIGEAQTTYKKRFPGAESEKYFPDALIEILADGDVCKLGSGIRSCFK